MQWINIKMKLRILIVALFWLIAAGASYLTHWWFDAGRDSFFVIVSQNCTGPHDTPGVSIMGLNMWAVIIALFYTFKLAMRGNQKPADEK